MLLVTSGELAPRMTDTNTPPAKKRKHGLHLPRYFSSASTVSALACKKQSALV